jgi:hypothetical protein
MSVRALVVAGWIDWTVSVLQLNATPVQIQGNSSQQVFLNAVANGVYVGSRTNVRPSPSRISTGLHSELWSKHSGSAPVGLFPG